MSLDWMATNYLHLGDIQEKVKLLSSLNFGQVQTESNAYEPTVQHPQVGSKIILSRISLSNAVLMC